MSKQKRLQRKPKKPFLAILGVHTNSSPKTVKEWRVREVDRLVRKRLKRT